MIWLNFHITQTLNKFEFRRKEGDDGHWSCYALRPETFLKELEPLVRARGWLTPWDAQEIACSSGLATYSSRYE